MGKSFKITREENLQMVTHDMVISPSLLRLPTSEELPCSDDTPVDNEIQNSIPNLLAEILRLLWKNRPGWFWGVDMGIYYVYQQVKQPVIIPDAFLSIGVPDKSTGQGRLSYVLWEENNIPPIFVLEIVSKTPGGEYGDKMTKYAQLGALYYVIYNPHHWKRDKHKPFEVYRLEEGEYVLQSGEPYWMEEIGLAIGREVATYANLTREWLFWFDKQGNRYSLPEERMEQAEERAQKAEERTEQERQNAQQAEKRAQQAEERIEQERQNAKQQQKHFVTQLILKGYDLEEIATISGLSEQQIQEILAELASEDHD